MKFTYKWLKEYIDLDISPAELADKLTMVGLEVDSVESLFDNMADVKVARVVSVEGHPNADKLVLCTVDIGEGDNITVVCGAPNAKPDMVTAIALPGTVLPSGLKVKKAKIRGIESSGMLCSEKDLGISENHAGIMELDRALTAGTPLDDALELADSMIEVDLTPNRPDCTCVLGIAREVSGICRNSVIRPGRQDLPGLGESEVPFSIHIEAADACPRYTARLLTDVTIGPSPWWLRKRLLAVGQRPINNVVDITNFVMLEYGQPLHAFDYDKLEDGRIVVRLASAGEKFTTLDGVERVLDEQMLLICDGRRPVAVAGVMGGENSEVSNHTTRILLESAYFNPVSIRRTARRLKMGTDASYRFERGIDPLGTVEALDRAASLIMEIAGGRLLGSGVDQCDPSVKTPKSAIVLRVERTNKLIGTRLSADEMMRLLQGIELPGEILPSGDINVSVPSFRVDLDREIDLVEEIARLVGYNEIPVTLPHVPMIFPEREVQRDMRKHLSGILVSLGFSEAINYSFVSENHAIRLNPDKIHRETGPLVRLLNPLAAEQSVMRTTLLPGLLENVCHNNNHQVDDVKIFEIGKVFLPQPDSRQPDEPLHLSAVLNGRRYPGAPRVHYCGDTVDIYDVKGVLEEIFVGLRLGNVEFVAAEKPFARDGSCIALQKCGVVIGCFGQFAKHVLKEFGIRQDVFFLDLNLTIIASLAANPKAFLPLPRYPLVRWDIALVVPEETAVGEIMESVDAFDSEIVEGAELFDVYRGKPVEDGHKSVAISVIYRSLERTLDDDEVSKVHQQILDMLLSRFNGKLRES